jgi:hypothetical protein
MAIVSDHASMEIVDLLLKHDVNIRGSGATIAAAEIDNPDALKPYLITELI